MGEEFTDADIDGIFKDLDDDGGGTIDRLVIASLESGFYGCLFVRSWLSLPCSRLPNRSSGWSF